MKHLAAALLLACMALSLPGGRAAETPREMHGVADAFAAPGVGLAWGVLRGNNDRATVVVRIDADPGQYAFVAADGIDPFTQKRDPMLRATRVAGGVDVRVPRAHFADFPRTEVRFFESEDAMRADAPDLVVFYLGVPDTTPEIADEAKLGAYLTDRIKSARANPEGKTK